MHNVLQILLFLHSGHAFGVCNALRTPRHMLNSIRICSTVSSRHLVLGKNRLWGVYGPPQTISDRAWTPPESSVGCVRPSTDDFRIVCGVCTALHRRFLTGPGLLQNRLWGVYGPPQTISDTSARFTPHWLSLEHCPPCVWGSEADGLILYGRWSVEPEEAAEVEDVVGDLIRDDWA